MDGESKFGEIEIRGERWRWAAIGRVRAGARADSGMTWSVSFRDTGDSDRGFWCEVRNKDTTRLSEARLRALFEEARAARREATGSQEI